MSGGSPEERPGATPSNSVDEPPSREAAPSSLASRSLTTFGSSIAVAGLSFLNVIVTSRSLGPEGRGEVAFLFAIATLSANLALLGVGDATANLASAEKHRRSSLLTNCILFALVFGATAIAVTVLLIRLFPAVGGGLAPALLALALASIPIIVLDLYLRLLAQASYGFAWTNAAWIVATSVSLVANVALAVAGYLTVGTVLAAAIVGQAIGVAIVVWYLVRHDSGIGRADVALARRALGFGVKSHIGRVAQIGNYRLDHWILGAVAGQRELGLYSVAVAWAEALFYLPSSLEQAQRPDLMRAGRSEARIQATRVFRLALIVTSGLALLLIVFATPLIVWVFGKEFAPAVTDLRILAFGGLGMVGLRIFSGALIAQRFPWRASGALTIAFAITVSLDVLLIPSFGAGGASAARTAAYLVGGAVCAFIFARALGGSAGDYVLRGRDVVELKAMVRSAASRLPTRR